MNAGNEHEATIVGYYDGDYPAESGSLYPENFDETTEFQGLRHDVTRYCALTRDTAGPVLELCCGTGRVAIPLARKGRDVVGVDLSELMLERFRQNLTREPKEVRDRVTLVHQDVSELRVDRQDFATAIIAFNSLLCIPDFPAQCATLAKVGKHLPAGGKLIIDIVNPFALKLKGDPVPKPFFTRRHPETGNSYTRFAMAGPLDEQQRQRLHGWYDEVDGNGMLRRQPYSMFWRPIFRFEIELMLRQAGFEIEKIEGDHQCRPYRVGCSRMFIQARRNDA